jgi:muconolactone delta-isomerase
MLAMKYVLTWWERPAASAADYEGAQKRVLQVFQQWKMPESLNFREFLVRVGEFGGYAVIETDKPEDLHRVTTALAVFEFKLEPVLDVMDAVAVEVESINWRDSLSA